jgi:hypothetical protein
MGKKWQAFARQDFFNPDAISIGDFQSPKFAKVNKLVF